MAKHDKEHKKKRAGDAPDDAASGERYTPGRGRCPRIESVGVQGLLGQNALS